MVDTATLQLLLPEAQPYAVCVGCCALQLIAPVTLQYWVQLADVKLPPHQTCPALDAYWYCVPGLFVGHAALAPLQLLYVLVALQAPFVPDHVVLPEQRVVVALYAHEPEPSAQ